MSGSTVTSNTVHERGELVTDSDGGDGELLLVVEQTEVQIDEYTIFETPEGDSDVTVKTYNEGYPETELVTVAVYVDRLDDEFGTWSTEMVLSKYDDGVLEEQVTEYSFPSSRLEPTSE